MTGPTPPNRAVVVAMTVVSVSATAAATALIMTGRPIGDLLAVLAVAGAPVLAYFGAQLHGAVQKGNELANGNLSAERDRNAELTAQLVQLATAFTPPGPPATSEEPAP